MAEIYEGTKFNYVEISKDFSVQKDLQKLMKWCSIFNKHNFAPLYNGGSSGNLSYRIKANSNKFIITASHTALRENMINSDFSEVKYCSVKDNIVKAIGKRAPSSESLMHYLIYKNRADVNAIFHGHSIDIMQLAKQKAFPETKFEIPYGTVELAYDVAETLQNSSIVILKNHGFISVGKTMEDAGKQILDFI